ncbi:hypothetical protein [Sphingomonas oryzagri]|uniref:PhnA-like protein n=1 Tax=Sphingomonas oryzagri TaxID=3042314 RepID=A0ABT6N293_9SPHN|nr:hypothetical protein [Sphingomonas oryzagri]MDH7639380.1 hypothetical protein [Sphingomonas oryzagri]
MPTYTDAALDARLPFVAPRMTWGAIFAGVAIALAIELMFALLGAGIGLSMIDPAAGDSASAGGLGLGGLIWWGLGTILALAAGAYASVCTAGITRPFDGAVHGVAIWGVTVLLTVYLLTSAIGGIVGGAFSALGGLAGAAGSSVGAVAPTVAQAAGIDQGDVNDQVSALIKPAPADPASMTREESRKAIIAEMPALARGGDDGRDAENRIADIIAAQDKVSHDVALMRVEQAKQRFLAAKHDTIATAKSATSHGASIAAGTSFTAFLVLLLGGIAAAAAGQLATRRGETL